MFRIVKNDTASDAKFKLMFGMVGLQVVVQSTWCGAGICFLLICLWLSRSRLLMLCLKVGVNMEELKTNVLGHKRPFNTSMRMSG